MYRVLQGNIGEVADATYKAGVEMKRGMLVVKGTDGKVTFPTEETDKNVFFVGKEFISAGVDGERDLPDYDSKFENIVADERVVLEKPTTLGEYFTTEANGVFTKGSYATVGTDGKLAPSTTATKFVIKDTAYSDCGKTATGIVFEVLD